MYSGGKLYDRSVEIQIYTFHPLLGIGNASSMLRTLDASEEQSTKTFLRDEDRTEVSVHAGSIHSLLSIWYHFRMYNL